MLAAKVLQAYKKPRHGLPGEQCFDHQSPNNLPLFELFTMKLYLILGLLVVAAVVTAMPAEGQKGDLAELEHDMDGEELLHKLWLKHHAKKAAKGKGHVAPVPVYAPPPPPPVYVPHPVPVKAVKVKKIKG